MHSFNSLIYPFFAAIGIWCAVGCDIPPCAQELGGETLAVSFVEPYKAGETNTLFDRRFAGNSIANCTGGISAGTKWRFRASEDTFKASGGACTCRVANVVDIGAPTQEPTDGSIPRCEQGTSMLASFVGTIDGCSALVEMYLDVPDPGADLFARPKSGGLPPVLLRRKLYGRNIEGSECPFVRGCEDVWVVKVEKEK